jgi:glycosyltransferase involved in cell wall biosynthesis
VLPSVWFEGFPMVLREACAFGTPAAVSDIGSLPGIVHAGRTGVVFAPGSPAALLDQVRRLWSNPDALRAMSRESRAEFETHYAEAGNYRALMRVYEHASAQRRKGIAA